MSVWKYEINDGLVAFYESGIERNIDKVFDTLNAAEARIAELEAAQRWIPVSEKPLEAGTFFVLLKNGEVTKDFTFIDGGRYYWWNHGANITHWMPLPKLPEVQESEATSCKFCGSNKSDRRMNSIVCSGCGRKIGNVAPPEVQE